MAATLTPAELADVRRFCGYPIAGATLPPAVVSGSDMLVAVLASLTDVAVATLRRVYLSPLTEMEAGLFGAADGLDIKKAAVYERNLGELAERDALFAAWRGRLCSFLGVPPGPGALASPGLTAGAGAGAAFAPAIYTV